MPDCATRRHATNYDVSAPAAASVGQTRSRWRKLVSSHAPRTGLLITPLSQVKPRTRHLRTLHKAPRRRAIIARSRRHAQLATPATVDVVINTLRIRALQRVTNALQIPITLPRRKRQRRNLPLKQARHTALYRISTLRTRRTRLATPTCTLVRSVTLIRRLCSTFTSSPYNIRIRCARSSHSRAGFNRQIRCLR